MKKLLIYSFVVLSNIVTSTLYATSYQVFAGINFSNPAALNSVKEAEVVLGGASLFSRMHFEGTAAGVPGTTTSNTTDFIPYGRIALRLSPKWVAGIDITQPYFTNFQYPRNSFANMFATETIIRDTNYSPRVSYQATEKLAVGLGFDINNFYNGQLNFAVPPLGLMTNKADSWAYGWDAGLFYVISPVTFLNLIYYSKIIQHAQGTSTLGSLVSRSFSADVKLPTTYIINVIHMFSPLWALSATVRYAEWNILRFTVLQNTPLGTLTIPNHFYNNVSTELATRYQINEKWAGMAAIDYEPNIQPTYTRNIGLPTYTRVIPAVGAEYEIGKGFKAKLIYAHVFSKPPINMSIATGQHIQGHAYLNADAWDLTFTYAI